MSQKNGFPKHIGSVQQFAGQTGYYSSPTQVNCISALETFMMLSLLKEEGKGIFLLKKIAFFPLLSIIFEIFFVLSVKIAIFVPKRCGK
ncbi:MAG: hypothetical protein K5683_08020 [Prevotella sp.]|nr:hypothetical protein [Prevotella sp.]